MFDGPSIVAALRDCGITHVVWIPDSELGKWESDLEASPDLELIRPCREGEAIVLAAGLLLGGKRPIVCIQCTGLFEAGDALRNIIHDLNLPLFFLVGVRSFYAHQQQQTKDNCPVFTEPILQAWNLNYRILTDDNSIDDLTHEYRQAQQQQRAHVVLLAE